MSPTAILIIILLVYLLGGGFAYRSNPQWGGGIGIGGLILIILVVYLLLGRGF